MWLLCEFQWIRLPHWGTYVDWGRGTRSTHTVTGLLAGMRAGTPMRLLLLCSVVRPSSG